MSKEEESARQKLRDAASAGRRPQILAQNSAETPGSELDDSRPVSKVNCTAEKQWYLECFKPFDSLQNKRRILFKG
jgi:hypothetical protein